MVYKSTFALLLTMPFFLQAGAGLELELRYDDEFSAFLFGTYSTYYATGKLTIDYTTSFPENITIKVEHNKFANKEDLAIAPVLAGIADGLLNIGPHYLKKYYQGKKLENYFENSFLEKHKKNKASLQESKEQYHD